MSFMFVLQRFYDSGCCSEPTGTERTHVSRFHTRAGAGKTTPALPARKRVRFFRFPVN